jgi:hypothetical protein
MRKKGKIKGLLVAGLLVLGLGSALAGSLLPNGEQTFVDQNGAPYSAGSVYFYIPSTLTPKTTWSNPGQTVVNSNPVVLDSAGRAIIYGAGSYRQILKDVNGNTIWDQLTQAIGSGGTIINGTVTTSGPVASCSGNFPVNNGTAAAITLTLPASPGDGDSCSFSDVGNNATSYPIVLALNGKFLNTGQASYTMDFSGQAVTLTYMAGVNKWIVN